MFAGWLSPRLHRTEENLWGLPVTSGQPSGHQLSSGVYSISVACPFRPNRYFKHHRSPNVTDCELLNAVT
jgi:hypothetical protein